MKKTWHFKKSEITYPIDDNDRVRSFGGRQFNAQTFFGALNAKYFFKNDFGKCKELMSNQFEYRRVLYEYLKAAKDAGTSIEQAIKFHKDAIAYQVSAEIRKGRQKDQAPGAIVHANTSEDFSYSILGAGRLDESGCWSGAMFGACENIINKESLRDLDDYISSIYISNHLFEKNSPMVPCNFFLASYGKWHAENEISREFVIELVEKRRQLFLDEAFAAGHFIESPESGTPILNVRSGERNEKIHLPIVVHDLASCTYAVIANGKETELSEWLRQNGLGSVGMMPKLIENLGQHAAEKDYFEALAGMMRERKVICCPDSRSLRENTGIIKRLGGIVSKFLRERILTKSYIKTVHVDLHFECGYLTTAMKIHDVGRELGGIFKKGKGDGERLRKYFEAALRRIFKGEHSYFNLNTFIEYMEAINGKELSKGTKKFLSDLLVSPIADTRNTVAHLYRNGFIRWHKREETIAMPLATNVDRKITEMGYGDLLSPDRSDADRVKYYRAVTLAVADNEQKSWVNHEEKLRNEGKIKEKVHIRVRVEDFVTGLVYYTKDGFDLYDIVSNKKFTDNVLALAA